MSRYGRRALLGAWLAVLAPVGAGSSWAAGVVGNGTPGSCTEGALNAALVGGGTVTFNCGASPVVIPVTAQKVIATATTVDGGNPDLIILDGGGTSRHLTTNQLVPLTVRNLTLRNGRCPNPDPGQPSPGYGGSIRSGIASPLTVTDSRFINNACDVAGIDVGGGAIRQRRGSLLVQRTLFQGNRAGNAGGISSSDSVVTIEDSQFIGNTTNAHTTGFSGVGGGFYNDEAGDGLITIRRTSFINNTATFAAGGLQSFFVPGDQGLVLEDCTFQGNSSPGAGGAALVQNNAPGPFAPMTVTRTTFAGNSGGDGAGLFINNTPSQITNSTLSGNVATGVGGGLFVFGVPVTLTHVTIAGNQAGSAGGAVAFSNASGSLRGSIVASNTGGGGQCNLPLTNAGFNVQFPGPASCAAGALVADPLLGPLASNGGLTQTRAIGSASPARNLVTSGCPPPATDQRGVARPAGACDAGSFESNAILNIAGTSVTEGNAGTTPATFTVTLTEASSQTVTVGYGPVNGTALAGADYTVAAGTLTFPPGTTSRTISVSIVGDTLDEDDETFAITLFTPVGAPLGTASAVGFILDNDAAPNVLAGDCASAEGGVCALGVALTAASGKVITVPFATANGSATSGSDFVATSGTLVFPAGVQGFIVNVQTLGDFTDEIDETFVMNLGTPTNATLGDGQGAAVIDDDDGPAIGINNAILNEGNAGTTPLGVAVVLSGPSPQTVTVAFATSDGTADAGSDYATVSGTVTFTPGSTMRTVTVNVNGDTLDEPSEHFHVNLASAVDGTIVIPSAIGTIVDDDGAALTLAGLSHGSRLRGGFAGGADLYVLSTPGRTSWEVVLDEVSGDASGPGGPSLQRVDNNLTSVLQDSTAVGAASARTLRWQNTIGLAESSYVRVASTQCTTNCGPDDTYRLRAYETTLQVPRFNNAGSQVTVLVLQNPTNATISGTASFWGSGSVLLGAHTFTLAARASQAISTAGITGVAGQSGGITITHNGRYGELVGKAVALEPATGFSFDATMAPRLR